jgi:hypothetical protein
MSATRLKVKIEEQEKTIDKLNIKIQSLENYLKQDNVQISLVKKIKQ